MGSYNRSGWGKLVNINRVNETSKETKLFNVKHKRNKMDNGKLLM